MYLTEQMGVLDCFHAGFICFNGPSQRGFPGRSQRIFLPKTSSPGFSFVASMQFGQCTAYFTLSLRYLNPELRKWTRTLLVTEVEASSAISQGKMAERSKALCSGFLSIAVRKGVGSNPTLVIPFAFWCIVISIPFLSLFTFLFFAS
ncbi:hypothetical protein GE21DRAFT_1118753 [Neurospora crassa]|nr:hypothetical protein GE21DRAFT_1118753 [Neurospora crassa]